MNFANQTFYEKAAFENRFDDNARKSVWGIKNILERDQRLLNLNYIVNARVSIHKGKVWDIMCVQVN